jgi:hypothetical protein
LGEAAPDFATLNMGCFLVRGGGCCYKSRMARTPFRDSRSEAEKDFKAATTKQADLPPPSIPGARA